MSPGSWLGSRLPWMSGTRTADERLEDALFTGLRLAEGVDVECAARRYGVDVWGRFGDELQPFIDAGVLLREGPQLRLTREGMLVANEVMQGFCMNPSCFALSLPSVLAAGRRVR